MGVAALLAAGAISIGADASNGGLLTADASYGTDGLAQGPALAGLSAADSTVDRLGRAVVVGSAPRPSGGREVVVIRFTRDGSLDRTFGDSGRAAIGTQDALLFPNAVSVDRRGRAVVVAAGSSDANGWVFRLLANGRPDLGFGSGGAATVPMTVADVDASGAGGPVLAGAVVDGEPQSSAPAVMRLTDAGGADPAFGRGGVAAIDVTTAHPRRTRSFATRVRIDRSGRVVAAGQAGGTGAGAATFVARMRPDGSPDRTFAATGLVVLRHLLRGSAGPVGWGLALRRKGGVLVAGSAPGRSLAVVALSASGRHTAGFGARGLALVPARQGAEHVAEARDGSLVVASRTAIVRISADGTQSRVAALLARSPGPVFFLAGLEIGPDDRLFAGGQRYVRSAGPEPGTSRLAVGRYRLLR